MITVKSGVCYISLTHTHTHTHTHTEKRTEKGTDAFWANDALFCVIVLLVL